MGAASWGDLARSDHRHLDDRHPRRPYDVPPATSRNIITYETDLTDAQWARIEPLLPPPETFGVPRTTRMTNLQHAVNTKLYRLKMGGQ